MGPLNGTILWLHGNFPTVFWGSEFVKLVWEIYQMGKKKIDETTP